MEFVPAPGVLMMEMRYEWNSIPCENCLYFNYGDSFGVADFNLLADRLVDNWDTNVKAHVAATCFLREVFGTDLTSDTAPTYTLPLVPAHQGGSLSPSSPGSITKAYYFRTAGRGRSSRGRNYLIGAVEDVVAGNFITTDWIGYFDNFYNQVDADADDIGTQWCVVSRVHNGLPRETALVQRITAWGVANTKVNTMKGRLK